MTYTLLRSMTSDKRVPVAASNKNPQNPIMDLSKHLAISFQKHQRFQNQTEIQDVKYEHFDWIARKTTSKVAMQIWPMLDNIDRIWPWLDAEN